MNEYALIWYKNVSRHFKKCFFFRSSISSSVVLALFHLILHHYSPYESKVELESYLGTEQPSKNQRAIIFECPSIQSPQPPGLDNPRVVKYSDGDAGYSTPDSLTFSLSLAPSLSHFFFLSSSHCPSVSIFLFYLPFSLYNSLTHSALTDLNLVSGRLLSAAETRAVANLCLSLSLYIYIYLYIQISFSIYLSFFLSFFISHLFTFPASKRLDLVYGRKPRRQCS